MWTHAIEVGRQYKLRPGAVFHIIAAYHRIDENDDLAPGRLRDALQAGDHQEIHNLLIEMDEEYKTLPESPLHHDNRCPIHRRRN